MEHKVHIPSHLLQHEDKILYWDGNWLITNSIDHNGEPLIYQTIEHNMVHVYYDDGEFRFRTLASKKFYDDSDMFWNYIKGKVKEMKGENSPE